MVAPPKFKLFTAGIALATTLPALSGHAHAEACAAVHRSELQCPPHNDLGGEGHSRNPLRTPWATATTTGTSTAVPSLAPWLFNPDALQR